MRLTWARRGLSCLGLMLAAGAMHGAPAQATVSFQVTGRPQAVRPIADNFLGLAFEFRSIPQLVGSPTAVNPVLLQLIRNLTPTGRPAIRVGGQSTDRSWWPVPGVKQPLGVTYDLTPSWNAAAKALAVALNAQYSLGVALEPDSPQIAKVEADHFLDGVGRGNIASLQLGNEPELYDGTPWYRVLNGKPIPWFSHDGSPAYARPKATWNAQGFIGDFQRTRAAIPHVALAGPETGNLTFLSAFTHLMSKGGQVHTLTWHAYGLNNCVTNPASSDYPSVPNLLTEIASRNPVSDIGPYVADAHRAGGLFRVDEMGSVTCNGKLGVSNTFASSLWALDSLFSVAAANVDGVNLHTFPGSDNGLFDFTDTDGHWAGQVHPLYYGALMFAQAAPAGSKLLAITGGGLGTLRTWATLGLDHRTRVLVINDSLASPVQVAFRIHGPARTGSVERLTAPSAYAINHVSLGGRSFGKNTGSGALNAPVPQTITAHGGSFTLTLPRSSAALITLPPGAQPASTPGKPGASESSLTCEPTELAPPAGPLDPIHPCNQFDPFS